MSKTQFECQASGNMFYLLKRQRRLRLLRAAKGHFSNLLQPFGDLQAHSSLRPLYKPASYHLEARLAKEHRGVDSGENAALEAEACQLTVELKRANEERDTLKKGRHVLCQAV